MFKEMRRKDRMLTKEELLDIMATAEYGVLSTVGEDGWPYGVPVNFVYNGGKIYFHAALTGQKLDNILFNNKVSFCVVKDVELIPEDFSTRFKSVIAFGEVTEVPENGKQEIYKLIIEKFSMDFKSAGMDYARTDGPKAKVFQIDVQNIAAKGKK